jgi:gamma-glutamyltranspeptidase/glutathione hydrolase
MHNASLQRRLARFLPLSLLFFCILGLVGCDTSPGGAQTTDGQSDPEGAPATSLEAAADTEAQPVSEARPWPYGAMVSVANPHAAQAAADVIARGGHAVDAAIAAHTVLGLVEPQSSGIGGGGFMLVYERATDQLIAYDGREMAPAGAGADMFLAEDEAMPYLRAWLSVFGV